MTTFDHLLAGVLVLVLPALTTWNVPELARRIEADPLNARKNEYIWNIVLLWDYVGTDRRLEVYRPPMPIRHWRARRRT